MEFKEKKLPEATKHLRQAIEQYEEKETELNYLTVSKTFEIAIEYAWRTLKRMVEDQGLEAPAPKIVIKQAVKLKLIDETETWLDAIEARNNSVHDYFGISKEEYLDLAKSLLKLLEDFNKKK